MSEKTEKDERDPLRPLILLLGEFSVYASERRGSIGSDIHGDPTQRCLRAIEEARALFASHYVPRERLEALARYWRKLYEDAKGRAHTSGEFFGTAVALYNLANQLERALDFEDAVTNPVGAKTPEPTSPRESNGLIECLKCQKREPTYAVVMDTGEGLPPGWGIAPARLAALEISGGWYCGDCLPLMVAEIEAQNARIRKMSGI